MRLAYSLGYHPELLVMSASLRCLCRFLSRVYHFMRYANNQVMCGFNAVCRYPDNVVFGALIYTMIPIPVSVRCYAKLNLISVRELPSLKRGGSPEIFVSRR